MAIVKDGKKECIECKEWRPLKDFYKDKNQCKKCKNIICKKWRKDNRGYHKKYNKKYREENVTYFKKYGEEFYQKNKEQLKKYSQDWRISNGIITGTWQSKVEQIIEQYLIKKGFRIEKEKTFEDCRSKKGNLLFFDFYIPYLNLIVSMMVNIIIYQFLDKKN